MSQHDTAVKIIERAINSLETARPETHLIYSSTSHAAVTLAHELKVIDGKEYLRYCERIRAIDARFMGIDLRATA